VFRGGCISISEAIARGEAAWAIDETTLYSVRARGCTRVGVRVEDTGDLFLTDIAHFFDLTRARIRDYTGVGRGGSRQRYLPFQHFQYRI
ncbi:hypothetical protein OFC55_34005, partial [Escherichia coli]|nr:hypothetical protein [Escherichia coli]